MCSKCINQMQMSGTAATANSRSGPAWAIRSRTRSRSIHRGACANAGSEGLMCRSRKRRDCSVCPSSPHGSPSAGPGSTGSCDSCLHARGSYRHARGATPATLELASEPQRGAPFSSSSLSQQHFRIHHSTGSSSSTSECSIFTPMHRSSSECSHRRVPRSMLRTSSA